MAVQQQVADTAEKAEAYLAALAVEKAGYETRIARVRAGRQDPLSEGDLDARIGDVEAEEKRVSALLKKKAA